jgi:hypothetical protein
MNYQSIIEMFVESPVSEWMLVHGDGNHEAAFLRNDVNLRIVTSHEEEHVQNDDYKAPWANDFISSQANGRFYDLYYSSTLLYRFILVSVDSARALLPIPQQGTLTVTRAQWKIAEIFDELESLEEYAQRAGLIHGSETGL